MRNRARAAADAGRAAIAGARRSGFQAALLRRPARARRRLSSGHRLGLAGRSLRRRVAEGVSGRRGRGVGRRSRDSCPISTKPASDRSARCSTPSRRSQRAAASPRRGAWLKCCGSGSSFEPGRTAAAQRPRRRRTGAGIRLATIKRQGGYMAQDDLKKPGSILGDITPKTSDRNTDDEASALPADEDIDVDGRRLATWQQPSLRLARRDGGRDGRHRHRGRWHPQFPSGHGRDGWRHRQPAGIEPELER